MEKHQGPDGLDTKDIARVWPQDEGSFGGFFGFVGPGAM